MWKKAEELFLADNLHLSNEELSSALSRSINSIKSKKKRLGLNNKIKRGYKNNRLTLVDDPFLKQSGNQLRYFGVFLCTCGNLKEIRIDSVKNNITKHCGNCHYKSTEVKLLI